MATRNDQTGLARLPAVDRWLDSAGGRALIAEFTRQETADALRAELDALRAGVLAGVTDLPDFTGESFTAACRARIMAAREPSQRPVINASGIILHTNLGRAPLAAAARDAVTAAAADYTNLEFSLDTGERGSRMQHVEARLTRLSGAEAALVVNNGAAALLLALKALAGDGEVVVSRGELIEIGGAFRMPDVIADSGARMVEVGTTNRTTIADYANAIQAATRVLLASHPSNYRIVGFTARPTHRELAALGAAHGCHSILDLGSGSLVDLAPFGLESEPTVAQAVASGVDLVTFSGDKLLGGPQAGIIVGRRAAIDRLRRSPLARATRIGKLPLAALEATLGLYLPPYDPLSEIPALRMLASPLTALERRAQRITAALGTTSHLRLRRTAVQAFAGGGASPMAAIPSLALAVTSDRATAAGLARQLRRQPLPVIARISQEQVLLDLRTILDDQETALVCALRALDESADQL